MKLLRLDFPLWISFMLLSIIPLKSESPEDANNEDGSDNDFENGSPEDVNEQDNEDMADNTDATDTTIYVIPVYQTEPTTTNTTETKPEGMEMAQSGQDAAKDGQRENDIAVKVGVPVTLLGLVITLGIIRLVSSGQLKNLVLGLRRIFGKIPEKSIPMYTANGSSSQNGTNEMFANPTYAVQSNHESIQSECMPPSVYAHDNIGQGIFIYDNTEMLKNESDSTYQTIADGQFDPSFADFARSNV